MNDILDIGIEDMSWEQARDLEAFVKYHHAQALIGGMSRRLQSSSAANTGSLALPQKSLEGQARSVSLYGLKQDGQKTLVKLDNQTPKANGQS